MAETKAGREARQAGVLSHWPFGFEWIELIQKS